MRIPRWLAPLAKLVGENSRYRLDCIQLERTEEGKALAVVTDARLLLVVELPDLGKGQPGWKGLLPAKMLDAFCANAKATGIGSFEVSVKPGELALSSGDLIASVTADGRFPPWRELLAKAEAAPRIDAAANAGKYFPVRFTSIFLRNLIEALDKMGLDQIQFEVPVDTSVVLPCRFSAQSMDGDRRARGAIMTMSLIQEKGA